MKKIFLATLLALLSFNSLNVYALNHSQKSPQDIIIPILVCIDFPEVPQRVCKNYTITIPFPGNDYIVKPIVIDF